VRSRDQRAPAAGPVRRRCFCSLSTLPLMMMMMMMMMTPWTRVTRCQSSLVYDGVDLSVVHQHSTINNSEPLIQCSNIRQLGESGRLVHS